MTYQFFQLTFAPCSVWALATYLLKKTRLKVKYLNVLLALHFYDCKILVTLFTIVQIKSLIFLPMSIGSLH